MFPNLLETVDATMFLEFMKIKFEKIWSNVEAMWRRRLNGYAWSHERGNSKSWCTVRKKEREERKEEKERNEKKKKRCVVKREKETNFVAAK